MKSLATFFLIAIICIACQTKSTSRVSAASRPSAGPVQTVSKDDAKAYLALKNAPYFVTSVSITPKKDGLFEICDDANKNFCDLVHNKTGVLHSKFADLALSTGSAYVVFKEQRRTIIPGGTGGAVQWKISTALDRSFSLLIDNPDTLEAFFRQVHFYNNMTITLLDITTKEKAASDSSKSWFRTFKPTTTDPFVESPSARVSITKLLSGGREFCDGNVRAVIDDPKTITVPIPGNGAASDGHIIFCPWDTWPESIVATNGKVLANRSDTSLVERGPFKPASVVFGP